MMINNYKNLILPKQYQDTTLLNAIILTLKEVRKSHGVSLETFYFDTGIHLARIEQGKTNITVSTLAKICSYFKISLVDFFTKLEQENQQLKEQLKK